MENKFKYSFNEKRYHTYNYYLKSTYNTKVAKVILDAGFTCPNRDGKKAYGGCIYCSAQGAGDSNIALKKSLLEQYEANKAIMNNKWPIGLYIPYFQSFSNTYGPLSKIQEMMETFINNDEVCEIALATRCDCLEDDVISYLDSLTKIKPITLELGLQTSNDNTARMINRGHTFKEFLDTIHKLEKTNIKICVHVLNGLPFETKDDMLQTVKDIAHLNIHCVKIHMLHVLKDTPLEKLYYQKPFNLISREEYIELVVKQLELLKPEIVIERLTGDPIKEDLITPNWVLNKTTILNDIDKLMRQLDTYQGSKYEQ